MKQANIKKIAKGYRLKPETHRMIRTVQRFVRGDLDEAINTACRKFLNEIKETNRGKIIMRTITLTIFILLNVELAFSQWTVQQFNPDYHAAYFLNSASSPTGLAVGENGIIRRTTNRGITWTNIYSGTTEELISIEFGDFADTLEGYASGYNGVMLKTTNGGMNWIQQSSGTNFHIYDVAVGRGDTAIAGCFLGRLLKTTNGGLNWASQILGGGTSSIYSVHRYSFATFYACDGIGRVYVSNNAGTTWIQYSTSTSSPLYSITTGAGSTILSCGVSGVITRSTNSGANWTTIPSGVNVFLNVVQAVPGSGFVIAASDGSILKSTNLGLNFSVVATPANTPLNDVQLTSQFGEMMAFGNDGLIRHSSDYGANWSYRNYSLGGNVTSLSFTSPLIGFACATNGELFRTTNGGANWTSSFLASFDMTSIEFANSSTGYITAQSYPSDNNGTDCNILRSTNGGLTWWNLYTVSNMRELYAVDFVDASTGWCVGDNSVLGDGAVTELFKTTNAGVNWANVFNFNVNVNDIYFLNSATGWAAADNGNLARTTNGGLNWQQVSTPSSESYYSIIFVSQNQGYACGNNGIIITTTNGGQNWTLQNSGVTDKLNSIHFGSAASGICVGEHGARLRTSNGGLTWLNNREEANIEIFSCFMPTSTNAYVSGYLGYIANFGGIVTAIEPVSNTIASEYKLEQNYPNPFNPMTNFEFRIAEFGLVKIKVYGVTGEEVQTLVNEQLNPGTYKVQFDGSDLSSGVYFYKLITNEFTDTKKMILVK